jgi:hypothetical protein
MKVVWRLPPVAAAFVFVVAACGPDEPSERAACALTPPEVTPAAATAGASVTIRSTGFVCDHQLPEGEFFVEVALVMPGEDSAYVLGRAQAQADGSFELRAEVPATASEGEGTILLNPSRELLPPCDSGVDESDCPATPAALFTVEP